jgi:hypothetical protein
MKKAITPLISTIILLSFAIGLGVMVMSWGNSGKFILSIPAQTKESLLQRLEIPR